MRNADDIKLVLEALQKIREYSEDESQKIFIDGNITALNWVLKRK